MAILIINIIMGLGFAGIGFLCKSQPDLIAGYNTMSKDEKQNIDIAGLSTYMRNCLIKIGGLIILSTIIFKIINLESFGMVFIFSIILVGVGILLVKTQKYDHRKHDHNKKKKLFLIYVIFSIVCILFMAWTTIYEFIPSKIIFEEEKIEFTGSYGFELNISEIESFEMVEQIPAIKRRTNGVSMERINKGIFELKSGGKCRLWLNSYHPPYLTVIKNNGEIMDQPENLWSLKKAIALYYGHRL